MIPRFLPIEAGEPQDDPDFVVVPEQSIGNTDTTLAVAQPQPMVGHALPRRAAAATKREQFLNPVGMRFAIASNQGKVQGVTGMFNTATHGMGGTVAFGSEGQFALTDLQVRGPLFYLLAYLQQNYLNPALEDVQGRLQQGGVKGVLQPLQNTLAGLTNPSQVKALLDKAVEKPEARLALQDIGPAAELGPVERLVNVLKAHGVNLDKEGDIKPEDIKSRFTSVNLQRCLTVLFKKYKESGNSSYLKLLRLVQRAAATSVAEKTLSIGEGESTSHVQMPQVWNQAERVAYSRVVKQRLPGCRVVIRRDPTSVAALFVEDE